jgi:AraC family transcriptional regulator, positive regulator of tynA and feaB
MDVQQDTRGPDLSQVPPPRRRQLWDAWVREAFPGLALKAMPTGAPMAQGVSLGAAQMWSFEAPARTCVHGIANKGDDAGFVFIQLEGTTRLSGRERESRMTPGQICLGKVLDEPFEMESESASRHVIVELPWSDIARRHAFLASSPFHLIEGDAPAASLLRHMTLATLEAAHRLDAQQRRLTLAAWVQLLGIPGTTAADREGSQWRVLRALAEIERRLHEPQLNATTLAAEQHISRRRLDELFVAATSAPLSAHITQRRLERAAELLRDSAEAKRSIADIAYGVGFEHASHFTRAFKARWGTTPKAWRTRRP